MHHTVCGSICRTSANGHTDGIQVSPHALSLPPQGTAFGVVVMPALAVQVSRRALSEEAWVVLGRVRTIVGPQDTRGDRRRSPQELSRPPEPPRAATARKVARCRGRNGRHRTHHRPSDTEGDQRHGSPSRSRAWDSPAGTHRNDGRWDTRSGQARGRGRVPVPTSRRAGAQGASAGVIARKPEAAQGRVTLGLPYARTPNNRAVPGREVPTPSDSRPTSLIAGRRESASVWLGLADESAMSSGSTHGPARARGRLHPLGIAVPSVPQSAHELHQ